MSELKPCPFCGGEAVKEFDSDWGMITRCTECSAIVTENQYLGITDSSVQWNTRAERTCHKTEDVSCSECGDEWACLCYEGERFTPTFCPNCGAKVARDER